jgi:hypothetical protein
MDIMIDFLALSDTMKNPPTSTASTATEKCNCGWTSYPHSCQPLLITSELAIDLVNWSLSRFTGRVLQLFLIPVVEQLATSKENWQGCEELLIGVYNGQIQNGSHTDKGMCLGIKPNVLRAKNKFMQK